MLGGDASRGIEHGCEVDSEVDEPHRVDKASKVQKRIE
jgi:hypothetical protein